MITHGATANGWTSRPGLSQRDVLAFIEAWHRNGEREPLDAYLGWIPEQPSVIDLNQAANQAAIA